MRPALFAISACAVLAGCSGELPDSNADTSASEGGGLFSSLRAPVTPENVTPTKAPLRKLPLAGGDVVLVEFDGYCIDPETWESRATNGFAIMASCNILSGGQSGANVAPLLLTVAVGPKGGGLPSPQGLASSAEARLLEGGDSDGVVLAHLDAGGDGIIQDGDPRHWRGAFLHGTRLVSLALYAPKGSAYSDARGGEFLRRAAGRISAASPKPDDAVSATEAQTAAPAGGNSLLNRLFNR